MVFGFGEGKIEIVLEKTIFAPGEVIRGKVVLSVNNPKQARRLRLVFTGIDKVTERITMGSRPSTRTTDRVFHSFAVDLDGEKEYSGTQEYPFEIAVPQIPQAAMPEGMLGTALAAASFLSGSMRRREWVLNASLDCPGFDINKKVQIQVNQ